MLIPLHNLQKKFKLHIGGFLHVGAHLAEELDAYRPYNCPIYWIEGIEEKYTELLRKLQPEPLNHVILAVIADEQGKAVTFNIANNGQSSSILKMDTHLESHPEVFFVSEETRYTDTLQNIIGVYKIPDTVNFLTLDIQGAELLALKGLGKYISQFDYIYTEVNVKHLYKDCALMSEIDSFLDAFDRVRTAVLEEYGWVDFPDLTRHLVALESNSTRGVYVRQAVY